jgi:hypothetical protein
MALSGFVDFFQKGKVIQFTEFALLNRVTLMALVANIFNLL